MTEYPGVFIDTESNFADSTGIVVIIQNSVPKGVGSLRYCLNKPTLLQKTINAKETCFFYIGMLFYQGDGVARAGLVLKEKDLFYKINPLDSVFIPCGQIVFKK